jgi:hypothetical protein
VLVLDALVDAEEALIAEVAQARRELQPEQVEEGEDEIRVARGVGGVLGDRDLGVVVE